MEHHNRACEIIDLGDAIPQTKGPGGNVYEIAFYQLLPRFAVK